MDANIGRPFMSTLAEAVPIGYPGRVSDLHIHVARNLHSDAAVRSMLASTFGLVGQLPSRVTTGCGVEVPRAMTSPRPESVTCLPCREHAVRQHTLAAEQAEQMIGMPGLGLQGEQLTLAAKQHREQARRFATG